MFLLARALLFGLFIFIGFTLANKILPQPKNKLIWGYWIFITIIFYFIDINNENFIIKLLDVPGLYIHFNEAITSTLIGIIGGFILEKYN